MRVWNPGGPASSRYLLIARLVRCCDAAASLAGYACVVERSQTSESCYLHIRRGGVWYGIRISAHEPAYDCSRDYESVIVPRHPSQREMTLWVRRVLSLVSHGGRVVADPNDVKLAIGRLGNFLMAGCRFRDAQGELWRWSAQRQGWRSESSTTADAVTRPTHKPRQILNRRIRSEVRHSQNVLAKWSVECGGRGDTICDRPGARQQV